MMSRYKTTKRQRRRTVRRRVKIGPTVGMVLAISASLVLGLVSITQSISRETAIYESTELREEKGGVEQEINELKLLEARAKTLDRIAQSEVREELVPIGDDVEYLDSEQAVAGASTEQ